MTENEVARSGKRDSLYCIEAEVTFLPKSEGARTAVPQLTNCYYRPHIVIGDPEQRRPIVSGNRIQEKYLSVCFLSGPPSAELGQKLMTEMALIYWPHPDYDAVIPGATFTIREGGTIVWVRLSN